MLAIFLAALTQTIVGTALPTMGRALGDVQSIPWIVTAYLLAATSALPLYGKLADIHGRRVVLFAALAIFVSGSALCALAPSMPVLIGARLLQGIGGGGLIALPETIIADMVAPRDRAGYQVYIAGAFFAASLAGPIAGGFLTDYLSWRMIFWINVPLGLAAALVSNTPLRHLPQNAHKHRLDVVGAFLLVAALATLILAISWAAKRDGWAGPQTIGMVALATLLAAAFVMWMRRVPAPLIPLEILSDKVVRLCLAAAALGVGLIVGLAIYVPIFLQHVRGLSASRAGIALLPFMAGSTVGALLAGHVMTRFERYKLLPLATLPCAALAALVLAIGAPTLPVWLIAAILPVLSIGLGTLLPIATVAIQNAVAVHHLGTATAASNVARQLGATVAVATFGALVFADHAHRATSEPFQTILAIVAGGVGVAFIVMLGLEERPLAAVSGSSDEGNLPD